MKRPQTWSRLGATAVMLGAMAALADGVSDAYQRGGRGGSGCSCLFWLLLLIIFRTGGVSWLHSFGAAWLPGIFGWSIWRAEHLSSGVRWVALISAALQAFFVVLGLIGAIVLGLIGHSLGLAAPASPTERREIFRAGFLRRCAQHAAPSVCSCVADEALASRDETDLKRLGFGLQKGALELWLTGAQRRCGSSTTLDGGALTQTAPRPRSPRPAAGDDADDRLGLNPWCTVTTKPVGAHVFVNDVDHGKAPLRIRVKAVQRNTVRVELDGFFPDSRVVEPNTNEETEVFLELRPASRLSITTDPPGAQVRVKGEVVLALTPGTTGPLEPGPVDVLITLAGHEPLQRPLTLGSTEEKLEVTLTPGAKVAVTSTPPEAEVRLDDVLVGVTPLDLYLSKGKHTVVVSLPGWSTVKKVFTKVKSGERLDATLVDVELAGFKRKVAQARKDYDKANTTLERLQSKVEHSAQPEKLERDLEKTEAAMEKTSVRLEKAEAALHEAEADRQPR